MPAYWENPLTGKVEDPPVNPDWAAQRPYHLADELSRGEEHVAALKGSAERIEANKPAANGRVFSDEVVAMKTEETRRMIEAAEGYVKQLRRQATDEFGDGLEGLVVSSPQRREFLKRFTVNAYSHAAEFGGN